MLFCENNSYAVVLITNTTVGHSSKEGHFWLQCSGFIHLYVFQVHPCYSMNQHLIFFYSWVFSTAWIIHLAYLNIWTVSLLLCLVLWVLVPKLLVAHPFWQCWGITSCHHSAVHQPGTSAFSSLEFTLQSELLVVILAFWSTARLSRMAALSYTLAHCSAQVWFSLHPLNLISTTNFPLNPPR